MKRALIQPRRCLNCRPCPVQTQCAMDAVLRETEDDKPWIDFYRCSGCLKCKLVCPGGAIEEIMRPCTGRPQMGW